MNNKLDFKAGILIKLKSRWCSSHWWPQYALVLETIDDKITLMNLELLIPLKLPLDNLDRFYEQTD
jgi:hypothetical protein